MRRIGIRRYEGEGAEAREDWVAEEGLLELSLGGGWRRRFVLTPERIQEFVYGHLLSEGFIERSADIISHRESLDTTRGSPGEVVRVEVALRKPPAPQDPAELIWTPCGQSPSAPELHSSGLTALSLRPLIAPQALYELPKLAAREAEEFQLTGAYHYAFLFDPAPKLLAAVKDIGRHNAFDKAVGVALLSGMDLGNTIVYTTGRISAEIAWKALRARVPLVASRGAALLGAITLARRYNLGLVGFLRGKRFNLYAGEDWLL